MAFTAVVFSPQSFELGGSRLTVALCGASGDGDLYVKRSSVPSVDSYDCAPLIDGSTNETCDFTENNDSQSFFINVDGFAGYSNAIVQAYFSELMTLGSANDFIWSGTQGSRTFWRIEVPAGRSQLRVRTTPTSAGGNSALYLRFGDAPLVAHSWYVMLEGTTSYSVTVDAVALAPRG